MAKFLVALWTLLENIYTNYLVVWTLYGDYHTERSPWPSLPPHVCMSVCCTRPGCQEKETTIETVAFSRHNGACREEMPEVCTMARAAHKYRATAGVSDPVQASEESDKGWQGEMVGWKDDWTGGGREVQQTGRLFQVTEEAVRHQRNTSRHDF